MFPLHTKILIADDMPSIRDLVVRELKQLGYNYIILAKDGLEAWEILEDEFKKGFPIELVISDWNMPYMAGIDLLKKVKNKKEFEQLPFILLTSENEKDMVTEAVFLGVSQYILKPFSTKTFSEKLNSAFLKHQKKKSA